MNAPPAFPPGTSWPPDFFLTAQNRSFPIIRPPPRFSPPFQFLSLSFTGRAPRPGAPPVYDPSALVPVLRLGEQVDGARGDAAVHLPQLRLKPRQVGGGARGARPAAASTARNTAGRMNARRMMTP